jgi:hypothetical protein
MLTRLENRGILLMPDFEQRNWLWQYNGPQPPVPFWDGQLIGWSAPFPTKGFVLLVCDRLQGLHGRYAGPHSISKRGRELTKQLVGKSEQRFRLSLVCQRETSQKPLSSAAGDVVRFDHALAVILLRLSDRSPVDSDLFALGN